MRARSGDITPDVDAWAQPSASSARTKRRQVIFTWMSCLEIDVQQLLRRERPQLGGGEVFVDLPGQPAADNGGGERRLDQAPAKRALGGGSPHVAWTGQAPHVVDQTGALGGRPARARIAIAKA